MRLYALIAGRAKLNFSSMLMRAHTAPTINQNHTGLCLGSSFQYGRSWCLGIPSSHQHEYRWFDHPKDRHILLRALTLPWLIWLPFSALYFTPLSVSEWTSFLLWWNVALAVRFPKVWGIFSLHSVPWLYISVCLVFFHGHGGCWVINGVRVTSGRADGVVVFYLQVIFVYSFFVNLNGFV